MTHRLAFAGFRHPHILALWRLAKTHPACEIVGAWEGDPETRARLEGEGEVAFTHEDFADLLQPDFCTAVAIGDVYARRGSLAISALRAGKHVISDKPVCTELGDLDEIAELVRGGRLCLGAQLDLVENRAFLKMRSIIQSGRIGRVCTMNVSAQHPLRMGTRAGWYFEPGQHGGTINDIGVHVFHLAPWLTGLSWDHVVDAREWNAKAVETPHFMDCAQVYGVLEGGATCFADLSYLAPDHLGYELPQYWRVTVHGTRGMCETGYSNDTVFLATDEDEILHYEPALEVPGRSYLDDFFDEIAGTPRQDGLSTESILSVSRLALEAQRQASRSR